MSVAAETAPVRLTDRRVAPSILSADFGRLAAQVQDVLDAGARVIHVDVMDGHFVPPITFGAVAVSAIADTVHAVGGLIDVHMMVERPEQHLGDIVKAGADSITIHFEATPHVHYALQQIREGGCSAGVAICPATPVKLLRDVAASDIDLALCMSVNPGWGGQTFIPGSADKLHRLRRMLHDGIAVEVDGGINEQTAQTVVSSGANLLVAGSALFGAADPAKAYAALAAAADAV